MKRHLISGYLRCASLLLVLTCCVIGCANVGQDLIKATEQSDVEGVRTALRSSPESGYKAEALVTAVKRNDQKIFDVLVENPDFALEPALIYAARFRNLKMANILMEKNARVLDQAVVAAARNGDIAMVKSLLAGGGSPNAQEAEAVPIVTGYQNGISIKGERRKIGWTALGAAIRAQRNDVVTLLLERGAGPDMPFMTEPYEITGTGLNIKNYVEMGADLTVSGSVIMPDGRTVGMGRLITYKKEVLSTPLIVAIKIRNLQIVRALLKHSADVYKPDSNGRTPITIATDLGYEEILRALEKRQ